MSNKEILLSNLSVIKSAMGNKRLLSPNMPYMKVFKIGNMLYTSAYTESIDMYLENYETKYSGTGNYDYKYFIDALTNLNDNVYLRNYRNDNGILLTDNESSVTLRNFVTQENESTDIEDYKAFIEEHGQEFNVNHYIEILNYLNKVSVENPDGSSYHSGIIYISKENTMLVGINYLLRINYQSNLEYVINTDEAKVVTSFLKTKSKTEQTAKMAYNEESNELYFKIGNSYLVIYNVKQDIPSRPTELFNSFVPTTKVEIPSQQLLRYLNLTSVFLPKNIDEVTLEVRKGKGSIGRDNADVGSSKGTFLAENCPNFNLRFKIDDVHRILKNMYHSDEDITTLEFNLEEDTAYFQHPLGDTFLSISVESYDSESNTL